ncbi:MAG: DNA polymerase IV [Desulfuromonadales bacterium]|uniref:DNA polymerase IV n=1 Tax=Desulfuromonas sp. KJ2020 TaxID=2919173 RepID=UPI003531A7C1
MGSTAEAMSTKQARQIIHVDMDAFYASVEQRDQPELRNRPVIVGGSRTRGVVSACSYEARAFGVRSAMPLARAVQLCPEAVVLPVRMEAYKAVSRKIFAIFRQFTDRVEPLSIDEAFLDVTGCERLLGEAVSIAQNIRNSIRKELALPASAGVAPNKYLAKLASEAAKPDGLKVIHPHEIEAFILPLPIGALWGIGSKGRERLNRLGINTIGELRRLSLAQLIQLFGVTGQRFYELARGIDDRPIIMDDTVKSIGQEETFPADLFDVDTLQTHLLRLTEKVASRLRKKSLLASALTIKVKYGNFEQVTRSKTLENPSASVPEFYPVAKELLSRTESGQRGIRLLGVTAGNLVPCETSQMSLFEDKCEKKKGKALDEAIDRIREKYGDPGITRGTLVD